MNETERPEKAKAPWHLWVAGVAALLWYASGTYTIFMAQAGMLEGISAEEAAYYAAQPRWFVVVTHVALLSALAGSILLLLRNSKAVRAFALSLAAIVITQLYDLAMGTSRSLASSGALIVNGLILMLAVLVLLYVLRLRKEGVLG